jgi:AcrR family transcriptional regulator
MSKTGMDEKERKILTAAVEAFSQYGVKRTTMRDIAESAGVARQTLYNFFPSKDAILRSIIRLHAHETHAAVRAYLESGKPVEEGLDIVFECIAVRPFEILRSTPHGNEILDGVNKAANEELQETYRGFRKLVSNILEKHREQIEQQGTKLDVFGDMLVTALVSFKKNARDREHLQQLYEAFKTPLLQMLGERPQNRPQS